MCVCFAGFFSGCFEFQRIFVSVFGYGIRVAIGMRVDVEQLYVTRYYVESMVLEDWKVELIVHTEGFSFFFFSRNRLNDFMKMYYSIFSLIISIHFSLRNNFRSREIFCLQQRCNNE